VPYQWPWTDLYNRPMPFKKWLWSRKFSLFYLAIIWSIVAILDFASTRRCEETWQLAFQCEQAVWMIKFYTEPWQFFSSLFTTPYFHNGLDHILFVTVFGFMLPVQSFEVQHGSKATAILFVLSYVFVVPFFGFLFNLGLEYWPTEEIILFGFERNWMGGSLGLYGIIGALSFFSRKRWFLLLMVLCFEIFINQMIVHIDIHISLIHLASTSAGWTMCWVWTRLDEGKAMADL